MEVEYNKETKTKREREGDDKTTTTPNPHSTSEDVHGEVTMCIASIARTLCDLRLCNGSCIPSQRGSRVLPQNMRLHELREIPAEFNPCRPILGQLNPRIGVSPELLCTEATEQMRPLRLRYAPPVWSYVRRCRLIVRGSRPPGRVSRPLPV